MTECYIPAHINLDEAGGRIDCTECSMGMDAPPMFGPIPRTDLLSAFVVQHATHNARGMPNGLTAGGRPTQRAAAAMRGES